MADTLIKQALIPTCHKCLYLQIIEEQTAANKIAVVDALYTYSQRVRHSHPVELPDQPEEP
jgi:hypothetical protein